MTEEIIIDGVNVAGCPNYYKKDGSCMSGDCDCTLCIHNDCYYKQLIRLEQVNKKLIEDNLNLSKENKNLKKQIESQKGLITVGGKQQYEMTMAYDKCKTALEEIKHILEIHKDELEECLHNDIDGMIQNKINEALQ